MKNVCEISFASFVHFEPFKLGKSVGIGGARRRRTTGGGVGRVGGGDGAVLPLAGRFGQGAEPGV